MENREIKQIVANNVKSLMSELNLSSVQLSQRCKTSTGTISKVINAAMNLSLAVLVDLASGLDVEPERLLRGLSRKKSKNVSINDTEAKKNELDIGVLSINNKRITCVKNTEGEIIGTSELEGGLDLAESFGKLKELIESCIYAAVPNQKSITLKNAKLTLVTQSYEFEETRDKFLYFSKRSFGDVVLMSDWQITYFAAFNETPGISLITDKGVSLSYMHDDGLKKLGGWKFPVYDLGGENWLGVETIKHTIEATEGYIPMSKLAQTVLSKFNGKIEKITETCFINADPDIYCLFTEPLLRAYFTDDEAAKEILNRGFTQIKRMIEHVDNIVGKQLKISINGSLADIYKILFPQERLITSPSDAEKVSLLADITKEYLLERGIK